MFPLRFGVQLLARWRQFLHYSSTPPAGTTAPCLRKRRQKSRNSGVDHEKIFFESHAGITTRGPSLIEVQLLTLSAPQPSRGSRAEGAMTQARMRVPGEVRLRVLSSLPQRHRDYFCEE